MKRYLAIDYGLRRIGLAGGDDLTRVAAPLEVLDVAGEAMQLQALKKYIRAYEPDALVVGLPMNMDGSEGPAARALRTFCDQLTQEHPIPVHLVDERLTSHAADASMSRSGLTHRQKKSRRDALAAAVILQDYLDKLPPCPPELDGGDTGGQG